MNHKIVLARLRQDKRLIDESNKSQQILRIIHKLNKKANPNWLARVQQNIKEILN